MIIAMLTLSWVILDTPTPTPTPGPENQPVSSFYVPPQQPPWPVPLLPTWGTGTPIPTLYAATPVHGTSYPGQVGTATAQVGQIQAPINAFSTPIAGLVGAGPTPDGDDISTGADLTGDGVVTFQTIGDQISAGIEDLVSAARGVVDGFVELATYSPWLIPVPIMLVAPTLIGMFMSLISLIVRGVQWLGNFVVKLLTLLGVWVPG